MVANVPATLKACFSLKQVMDWQGLSATTTSGFLAVSA
jgi:hypothetical protein